jgi:hypothetical protein
MITIRRNPNFTEWLNIDLWGKLKGNARTIGRAMKIARQLQTMEKNKGNQTQIKNYVG